MDHSLDHDSPQIPAEADLRAAMEQNGHDVAAGLTVPLADVLAELEGIESGVEARLRTRLAALLELKDGWHDGAGASITGATVGGAVRLLTARPTLADGCRIYPSGAGGLALEFIYGSWDYTVEIGPEGGTVQISGVKLVGPGEADCDVYEASGTGFLAEFDRLIGKTR